MLPPGVVRHSIDLAPARQAGEAAMTTEWTVTTGAERVALDPTGSTEVIFTVTNSSPVNDRAVLDVVVEPPTDRSWFTVEEPQRLITPRASVPFRVKVVVPPGAPPGTHFVKALVYSANTAPEETARYSNRVAFDVKAAAPAARPKWWIPILVGALLLAIVLGVVGFVVFRKDTPPPGGNGATSAPPTTPVGPDVTNLQTAHVRSNVVGPGQAATATATCPTGTTVIGGGYWLRSPVGMTIDSSRPAPSGQGWQVHGFNPTGSNFDFDVDVVCGSVRDRQVVSASATAQPGQPGIAVVLCPSGKISVGGGWSALGLVVDTSLPGAGQSNGWHIRAGNNTGETRAVTAFAVCATAPSRARADSSGTVQPSSRLEDGVDCPAGKVSTGGGFVFEPTSGVSLYISTKSSGQGWDVRADNRAGAVRTVNAFAVCVSSG
jgi:hypothetical protein